MAPMKLAFWNVNTGGTSFKDKKAVIEEWLTAVQPDVLIVEELGWDLAKDQPEFLPPGYNLIGLPSQQVRPLDTNGFKTPKCIAGFSRSGFARMKIGWVPPETLADLNQKRCILAIPPISKAGGISIYGIHANASTVGGNKAIQATRKFLKQASNPTKKNAKPARTVVGGDFNLAIKDAKAAFQSKNVAPILVHGGGGGASPGGPVHPLSYRGTELPFTQWSQRNDGIIDDQQQQKQRLLLDGPGEAKFFKKRASALMKIAPNQVLDYITHSAGVMVTALPNVPPTHVELWVKILVFFDHCPVVYQVT